MVQLNYFLQEIHILVLFSMLLSKEVQLKTLADKKIGNNYGRK